MNKKSGLTMVSIVIYVVIFFALAMIISGVTMVMDSNSLKDKGIIFCEEQLNKLQYNLVVSNENSKGNITKIENKLVFGNNDMYEYDSSTKTIYKNGGILIQNVEEFSIQNDVNNENYYKIVCGVKKYNQGKYGTTYLYIE